MVDFGIVVCVLNMEGVYDMEKRAEDTGYFDVIDFIKREYRLILGIAVVTGCLLGGLVLLLQKPTYQFTVLFKFPQYNSYVDLASTKAIAEQTIAAQVKSDSEKYRNINVVGSILKDTNVLSIKLYGPDSSALHEFRMQYASKLLPVMRDLSRERFIYEWQKAQATSDVHLVYSDFKEAIVFSDPYILNDLNAEITTVGINWKKWSATIAFLSFMIGVLIGILHYFYPKRDK